jgi:pimeloyl-ACP methyl ester carboxylesterase
VDVAAGVHRLRALEPLQYAATDLLNIAYYETGQRSGDAVMLLHGFPYDIHSYGEVAPILATWGCRVIVPYLRGHGSTRFRDVLTPRVGQQAAIGADVLALMDALRIRRAVVAGYDWGGRAANVVAALWPHRCLGLVCGNSYLIQDIAHASAARDPSAERRHWYQYYFLTDRGRAGLQAHRRELARVLWHDFSPQWHFDDDAFEQSATAFDNPDYVDVVVHSYRHRHGLAPGCLRYESIERQLALLPPISVPTVTLDGEQDGVVPAAPAIAAADHFTGPRIHRRVANAGHNLPQEAPAVFAEAVLEVLRMSPAG